MAETFDRLLLNGVTSGTGPEDKVGAYDFYEGSCEWSAGVSAGVVTFEWAPNPGYAGTWAVLGTQNFGANSITKAIYQACGGAIRARVSTPVVGGTVTVRRSLTVSDK